MTNQDTSLNGNPKTQARHAHDIVEFTSALLWLQQPLLPPGAVISPRVGTANILFGSRDRGLEVRGDPEATLAGQEALVDITTFEQLYRAMIEGTRG